MSSHVLYGRKREIFEFVQRYIEVNGYPPTVREIGAAVGLSSTGSVQAHLNDLRRFGLLEGEGRTLRQPKAAA